MKASIFEPIVSLGYEWVNVLNAKDLDVFATFDGRPCAATWKPVAVTRVRADRRQAFKASDFPWLGGHAIVMRQSAVTALREILDGNAEVLPLATDDDVKLFVLNAQVIAALDLHNSDVTMFPNTDRIMRINRVAFARNKIEGVDLFRLPHRASSTYVSERFVKCVKAAGLRGLDFNVVWSE